MENSLYSTYSLLSFRYHPTLFKHTGIFLNLNVSCTEFLPREEGMNMTAHTRHAELPHWSCPHSQPLWQQRKKTNIFHYGILLRE